MEANPENQNLEDLANSIKNIYIDSNDLLSISLDFSDIYFKRKEVEEEEFDKFWASSDLHSLVSSATQEAVTLALATLTLKEDIDFEKLINMVINWDTQKSLIGALSSDLLDKKILKNFVFTLRREVYSRVFAQNKALLNAAEIDFEIAEDRKNKFMEMNDGEI